MDCRGTKWDPAKLHTPQAMYMNFNKLCEVQVTVLKVPLLVQGNARFCGIVGTYQAGDYKIIIILLFLY